MATGTLIDLKSNPHGYISSLTSVIAAQKVQKENFSTQIFIETMTGASFSLPYSKIVSGSIRRVFYEGLSFDLSSLNVDEFAKILTIKPKILSRILDHTTQLDVVIATACNTEKVAAALFRGDSECALNLTFEIESRRKEITTLLTYQPLYVTQLASKTFIARKNPDTDHVEFYLTFGEKLGNGSFREAYPLYDYQRGTTHLVLSIENIKKEELAAVSKRCMHEGLLIDTMAGNAHIISSLFYAVHNYQFLLITERCDGRLDQLIKKNLSSKSYLKIFRQIVLGVIALHNKGIVHRDLKPANILFKAPDQIKIIDFNVSCFMNDESALKKTYGTITHQAPETFFKKPKEHPDRIDTWSLGVILYEFCEGERPGYTNQFKAPKVKGKEETPGKSSPKISPKQTPESSPKKEAPAAGGVKFYNRESPSEELFNFVSEEVKKLSFTRLNPEDPLIVLIKDLLQINPKDRLSASELLVRLDSILK